MSRACRIAALLTAGLAVAASPAAADHPRQPKVRCGQVITRDTVLANDLLDCPGTGLTIGADGVTLDLGGHVVDGTNAPGGDGIAVDGHAGVRIAHGTVRDFRVNGVALRDAPGSAVRGLTITRIGAGGVEGEDVSAGIFVQGSDDTGLDGNRISNDVDAYQADGIVVLRSARVAVTRNDSSRNAWNGMVLAGAPDARVLGNRTAANANSGILAADSPRVIVRGNASAGHGNPDTGGIVLLATPDGLVEGNLLQDDYTGISLENGTTQTKVRANAIRGGGAGIVVLDSDGNAVLDNDVADAGEVGLVLGEFGGDGSDANTVARNVVRGAHDGVLVEGGSSANVLRDNLSAHNAANGFLVQDPGNTLAHNTAKRNGARGIQAVAGTIDGGGNRASGNGVSPQCAGVMCR
jgi:hypothetical protein